MAQSGRDDNYFATALAVDTNGVTQPLRVDPATGYLLIDITVATSTSPATLSEKWDENRTPVSLAVEDGTDTTSPLIVDNRNGYLWVDVA